MESRITVLYLWCAYYTWAPQERRLCVCVCTWTPTSTIMIGELASKFAVCVIIVCTSMLWLFTELEMPSKHHAVMFFFWLFQLCWCWEWESLHMCTAMPKWSKSIQEHLDHRAVHGIMILQVMKGKQLKLIKVVVSWLKDHTHIHNFVVINFIFIFVAAFSDVINLLHYTFAFVIVLGTQQCTF